MVQKTIDRKELEGRYIVVGVPVSEDPCAMRGPGSQTMQDWHQGGERIIFGFEFEPYFPFYITKQVAQEVLENVRPLVPIAFDVRGSPSSRPTYVVKPRVRNDILQAITIQIPKQLYLRNWEKVRRWGDTEEVGEGEVRHRIWIEGNTLCRFYDAGAVLEARYKDINRVGDFTKARFRAQSGYSSNGLLLKGDNLSLIIDRAEQEARQEERKRKADSLKA